MVVGQYTEEEVAHTVTGVMADLPAQTIPRRGLALLCLAR